MTDKSKKRFSGVIFDMDGVIFDSEVLWQRAFKLANKQFGLNFTEEYRQSCCGKDENLIRSELRQTHPSLDADEYRDFIVDNVSQTIEKSGAPLKDGFCELVRYLKQNGYKTALATSSAKQRAQKLFAKKNLDIDEIFDGTVFCEDVKVSKPNPEIFLKAAKKLSLAPGECIVLEDSLNGLLAARLGGCASVMVVDLIEPDESAKNSCLFIARGLNEVTDFLKRDLA